MAVDEDLAQRIREALAERTDVTERRMFGGLAFMVGGHMTVGVRDDSIMARVGKPSHEDALSQPHARVMDFTGREMRGYVYVDAPGIATDDDLGAWLDRCIAFTQTLPPK